MFSMARRAEAESLLVAGDGEEIRVELRRHPRARRLILRLDPKRNCAVLTVPARTGARPISRFLEEHQNWLISAFRALPPRAAFTDGTALSILGEPVTIRHDPSHRGPCRRDGDLLLVGGDAPHLARRVRDYLKSLARAEIGHHVAAFAQDHGLKPGRITLRDQSSRWGSCSAKGDLSFNWRLVCAPAHVLRYVAAHEVAHLRHMDHSPAFWAFVTRIDPQWKRARGWLKANGAALHRIG